ncbi:MAG: phenylacetate--CoA ligase family protein [Ignavibacteria bacterium]|nr:phenylacetate--CoA ligase family protein [Ignavibacteria bacterium]
MSFLELSLKLKGFPLNEAEKELKRIQSLSPDEFAEWQERSKLDILKYHFEKNEFYRNKLSGKLPEKWEDVPILVKSDFQKSGKKLISDTFRENEIYTGYTSGSSGHPFHYAKDKFAHAMTWALIKDRYKSFGLTLDSKQARFYGIPFEKFDYAVEKTKDFLSNRVRFPVFDLSDSMLEKFLEKFRRIKFDYVYGYTNSIVMFARYLLKNNIVLKNFCPTLKICIATSENCTSEDKNIISKAFGVPAVNEYGTSEVDLIAFEDTDGKWRISGENVYMEILDDNGNNYGSGNEGRIILTALHNKAMPFIRYEIGDKAITSQTAGKTEITGLAGGVNDFVILPSGKKSSGVTFYFITRDVLEKSGLLREFIIKQTEINKFIFEVVSDEDIPVSDVKAIQKKMDLYLEPGLKFEIKRVEKIERTKAGKMKHFHSYLK